MEGNDYNVVIIVPGLPVDTIIIKGIKYVSPQHAESAEIKD